MAMLLVVGALTLGPPAHAQEATTISISVKNHRFQPAELHAPANVPIVLRVKNLDSTPMEFESVSLRVEKVVTGNSEGIIRLRPLAPGSYNFFDDFHQETNGVLVVR
ncbi:MAG TPA: cupredoxin domain-containing protein [Pseudolabrys sp.]